MRSVRKLVKLWSEADWNLQDDLGELARRLNGVVGEAVILGSVHNAFLGLCSTGSQTTDVNSRSSLCEADGCCCYSHCKLRHSPGVPLRQFMALTLRSSSYPSSQLIIRMFPMHLRKSSPQTTSQISC